MTNKEINAAYIGSQEVDKIYLGEDLVYGGGEPGPEPDYLTFNITSPGDIVWSSKYYEYPVTISYSKNGGPWTDIASASGSSAPHIAVSSGDVVRFSGNNLAYSGYYTYGSGQRPYTTTFGSSTCGAELSGNIMSMIDGSDFASSTTLVSSSTFSYFFEGFSGLTDASNLILPATTLAQSCYNSMFQGCTSLTTAPELPATTLAEGCYISMFDGCTSLTTAPELPATTLADYCYGDMFKYCSSLTTAPELPATTLALYCYYRMFYNCSNLNYIKCLAEGDLYDEEEMVDETYKIPLYTSGWLNGVSSTGTFVKSHNSICEWERNSVLGEEDGGGIPDGWVVENDDLSPIEECGSSLSQPLTLNIEDGGEILFKKSGSAPTVYLSYKVNDGQWIDFDTTTEHRIQVYEGDVVQYKAPSGSTNTTMASSLTGYNTFSGTTATFSVEGNIMSLLDGDNFAEMTSFNPVSRYNLVGVFRGCRNITDASNLALPATNLAYYCYHSMFLSCSSLTAAPALPATTLAQSCYYGMFQGCRSLTTAPELPATTLANYCYNSMFKGCTSLTAAPVLPATTLTTQCYYTMFSGCTSLNNITCLATNISASACLANWVNGVASTGTFVKEASMTSWPTGVSGIPEGWTVQDAT